MTKIEALELELAARKMVDGTELDWWEVIRERKCLAHFPQPIPSYFSIDEVELAIGIVQDKPVWEDDTIYGEDGLPRKANRDWDYPGAWSWNPPTPKTVMVELTIEDAETNMTYREAYDWLVWEEDYTEKEIADMLNGEGIQSIIDTALKLMKECEQA